MNNIFHAKEFTLERQLIKAVSTPGTGHDFTLASGDEMQITIDHIGTLMNVVR